MNGDVQKFYGCYVQAVWMKKSESSEDDVINDALAIFIRDQGEAFKYEYACREARNQAKWLAVYGEGSSKRTKKSALRAYTSSSQSDITTNSEIWPNTVFTASDGNKNGKKES